MLDLDPRPEHVRWLTAAGRVLVRTDRILAGRDDLGFIVENGGPAPAWSNGTDVSIRATDWQRSWEDTGAVARLMGLNYHELCHVMFTPRIKEMSTSNLRQIYNLAEDQRIETMFAALYSPSIPFFTQAVLDLIVADGMNADTLWVLVAGRRYLSVEVRDVARRAYRGDATEWKALMDEYLLIDWDRQRSRGIELVKLMEAHLGDMAPPEGCCARVTGKGATASDEADEARARVAEDLDEEEAEEDTPEPEGEDDEAPEADEADGATSPEPEVDPGTDEDTEDEAQGGEADTEAPDTDDQPEAEADGQGSGPAEEQAEDEDLDEPSQSEIDEALAAE